MEPTFNDYCKVEPLSDNQVSEMKDFFSSPEDKGLEVTLEATHSGFMNDNLRFYIPSRMRDGCKTFTQRKKPAKILKHHNAQSDPVGIIVDAEYVDTIPEALIDNKNIQILNDSSFPIKKQISAAKRLMKSGIMSSEDWKGLGYIKLKAVVLDEKTIKQVQTGLFDAVSTSFSSPGHVYCNVCGQNLVTDGFCEHEPGKLYKDNEEDDEDPGVVCGMIPGVHNYNECSFVVVDGDPLTAVRLGFEDSLKSYEIPVEDWRSHSFANNNSFVYEFRDFKEANNMDQIKLSDAQKEVFKVIKKLRPELDDKTASEFTVKISELKQEDGKFPYQEEAMIADEVAIEYALSDLETADQEVNADDVANEMQVELKKMLDEGILDEETWKAADAKLSTSKRKSLPGSTFCGPDRSFPVPDCAHVTAARRLVGRYKGPGSKSKILACVNRKAKALGCDSKKEDSAVPSQETKEQSKDALFTLPTCEQLKDLENKDAQTLFAMSEAELISRDLKVQRECSKCAESADLLDKAKQELKDSKEEVEDLKVTLKVLRVEMKNQMEDYFRQVDDYVSLGAELTTAKSEKLALVGVLSGKYDSLDKGMEALKDVDLSKEEPVLMDSFKIDEVITKLNDGLTQDNPKDNVDNPVANIDGDNNQLPDGLSGPAVAAIENIRDYIHSNDIGRAKNLYARMIARKVFDEKQVPFDSLQQKN